MGGKVSLPLTIEIAFSAGALDTGTLTWTDVSTYVRKESISFNRGWDAESQEPIAGRASLSFNNESGNFTPGKTGAFGLIRNRLPIRIKQGSTVLWTGLVESWRIGWTNGMRSKVDVTCVDRWAALRRLKIPADRIAGAARITKADVFFPFTDTGAPFREVSDAYPALGPQDLFGGLMPTFRGEAHPTDATQSSAVWRSPNQTVIWVSPYQSAPDTWSLDVGVSMVLVAKSVAHYSSDEDIQFRLTTDAGASTATIEFNWNAGVLGIQGTAVRGSGAQSVIGTAVPSSPALDGGWHVAVMTLKRTGTTLSMNLTVDGQTGSASGTFASDWSAAATSRVSIQMNTVAGAAGRGTYGAGGAMLYRRALSAAEAAFVSRQVTLWTGDTADARAASLSRYGSLSSALSTSGTFTIPMSKQDLADKPLADALLECAQAEDGALFIDTSGWPKITSRSWRTQATVAFTIPAKALASDIGWTLDDQQLTNSAAVDRMVGDATAGTATGRNDASVALYGEQKVSRQLWLYNTADAVERANAEANMWANPLPRSSELTVDLMTKGATISAATLLAADVGQRIAISGMPAEAPTQTNFYIEAISDAVTETSWLRTFTVSPRLDFLTLDDASSGAIDSTFVLAP